MLRSSYFGSKEAVLEYYTFSYFWHKEMLWGLFPIPGTHYILASNLTTDLVHKLIQCIIYKLM